MEQSPPDRGPDDLARDRRRRSDREPPRKVIPGFKQTVREFMASKTNWTGLTMTASAGVAYLTGELSASAALTPALTGVSLLFIRDALADKRGRDDR